METALARMATAFWGGRRSLRALLWQAAVGFIVYIYALCIMYVPGFVSLRRTVVRPGVIILCLCIGERSLHVGVFCMLYGPIGELSLGPVL